MINRRSQISDFNKLKSVRIRQSEVGNLRFE